MSKSILVIDTPECCFQCKFSGADRDYCCLKENMASDSNMISEGEYLNRKPDWCPLRDLPDKKPELKYHGNGCFGVNEAMKNSFNLGFNTCIDEILKGANGNDKRTV